MEKEQFPRRKNGVVPAKQWEKGDRKRQQVPTIPPYPILGNNMLRHAQDREKREIERHSRHPVNSC